MAQVILKNVWKRFDGTAAVKDVSLHVEDKEFCVLVGPSGCGKSTTLRIIAGLEDATEGDVYIGEKRVNDVPPKDRDIAMVFQNYALYPHMTVYQNMAFGLKLRGYSKKEIDTRVREAGDILNIGPLLERKPKALSGGQRQRVALGRAIVRKPKVFLFDEPLSNLDAKLRVQMRTELAKLHDQLKTTMIYVTHDQVEAMTLGDRVCVMKDGVIQQIEDPLDLYNHPDNRFVASFIGNPPMNFLDVELVKRDDGFWLQEDRFSVKILPQMEERLTPHLGQRLILGIRPEDIHDKLYHTGGATEANTILATVEVMEPMGSEIYLYLNTGKHNITARVHSHNQAKLGQDIELVFSMEKIHLFAKDTEQTII